MATYRYFLIGAVCVFGVIGAAGWIRQRSHRPKIAVQKPSQPVVEEVSLAAPKPAAPSKPAPAAKPVAAKSKPVPKPAPKAEPAPAASDDLPDADRIDQLFALDSSRLPIVETLSYTSRVPWLEGRPAWIADYATQFETSRHFIARSLNRKPDYFSQKVSPGDRFNVFRRDKKLQFHLLIDVARCKMWFYCIDAGSNERILLKTYRVGLGRQDSRKPSGSLTPLGKYELGDKIAIYKPGTMGTFQEQKTEMIRVFGTRWIPFQKEIEGCTEPAKALGIHGAPWLLDPVSGNLVEDSSKIGKYDSDGCIRLAQPDMEEIFSIIITKPTVVELVKDFHEAKLPGIERNLP